MVITRFISNCSFKLEIIVTILAAIIFGNIIFSSVIIAAFFAIALVALIFVSKSPLKALSLLIILVPFTKTGIFGVRVVNLPGAKPFLLLGLLVIVIAIINYRQSIKMPQYAFLFTIFSLTIFSICVLRSIPHLDTINSMILFEGEKLTYSTPLQYILSNFIKQLFYFMPLVIIIKFAKEIIHLEYLVNTLILALIAISICILLNIYYVSLDLGLHRNDLADFYILGFPIVLARYFLKKNIINLLSICFCVTGIGFLYCRTAYFILIFSFIFYLFISKRTKYLPLLIVISLGLSFILSSSIIERASKGIESGDRNEISAGRIDIIWIPLIDEYLQSPKKILFGNGRYALVSSDAVARGIAPNTMHPHNMYIEQILDTGILGFMPLMLFYILLFKKAYQNLSNTQNYKIKEYQYAVIVSMISYFIAGITGRSLFPILSNTFFWIIIGITIVIIRMVQQSGENINAKT